MAASGMAASGMDTSGMGTSGMHSIHNANVISFEAQAVEEPPLKIVNKLNTNHRHVSNIDCLMVHTACLVCFISTVNGCSKKAKMLRKMWR
jgi:hypothetical protein